jgi:hypothetical protein
MNRPTLKSEKARLRCLLDALPFGEVIKDVTILAELRHHKDWNEKTNHGQWHIKKCVYARDFRLEVYDNEGEWKDDISWNAALRCKLGLTIPQDTPGYKLRDAMRYEVWEQIRAVGADGLTQDVDHAGPGFAQIMRDFLAGEGLRSVDVEIEPAIPGRSCILKDRTLARKWCLYHKERATLVALSREDHCRVTKDRRK